MQFPHEFLNFLFRVLNFKIVFLKPSKQDRNIDVFFFIQPGFRIWVDLCLLELSNNGESCPRCPSQASAAHEH